MLSVAGAASAQPKAPEPPADPAQPADPVPPAPAQGDPETVGAASEGQQEQPTQNDQLPENDARPETTDGEFPRSGSQPGTPLKAYDAPENKGAPSAEKARGWSVPPGTESEDYVLFPARALLFPPKVLFQIVFAPIELLVAGIDRNHVIPRVVDFFYFDKAHTTGFMPSIGSETGYGFSYGAKVFHDNLLGNEESISASGRFGGRYVQSYEALFEGDRVAGTRLWLESRARYEVQPATLFFGFGGGDRAGTPGNLGPRDASIATRFQQERVLGLLRLGGTIGSPGDITKLGGTAIYNHRVFSAEQRSFAEPSIEQVYDTARIPGFDERLNLLELDVNLVRDTRDSSGLAASGYYFEALFGGVPPASHYQYFHYGAELTQYFDLYRKSRVLVVRAGIEGVVGNDDEIPFTDLPRLGGVHDLRGYLSDRFRDKVAAVATVEYRYPIHELLSGKLFVDAGDVGRDTADLFEPGPFENWKVGGGGGFLLHSKDSVLLSLDLAYGEEFTVFFTTSPLEFFHNRSRQL